jgi:hypothetical protein
MPVIDPKRKPMSFVIYSDNCLKICFLQMEYHAFDDASDVLSGFII